MTTMKDLCIPAKNPADLHKCPEFIFHTKYHTFYIFINAVVLIKTNYSCLHIMPLALYLLLAILARYAIISFCL